MAHHAKHSVVAIGDIISAEHWRGASLNNILVHIAITNYKGTENVVWLKSVTDEEYNSAVKK